MIIERINLEGSVNTRDLGGFKTKDGKTIKSKMLLRSGNLSKITLNDKRVLEEEYGVKAVIDFRTDTEESEKPDVILKNASYYRLRPLTEATMGVTHEKKTSLEMFMQEIDFKADPDEYMKRMYEKILLTDVGIWAYRDFFNILDKTDGCVLFHCTAGKDRAGLAAALTEYVLGVDFDTIADDYLKTDYFMREDNSIKFKEYIQIPNAEAYREYIIALMTVKRTYIEHIFDKLNEKFGSAQSYITDCLGIDCSVLERIKDKYLY